MLKKVLGTILACSFLFSCFPAPPASAADGPFSDWTEIKDLGNLDDSDLYWETEDTAEGLTINKGYFTNMTYGSNITQMPNFRWCVGGTPEGYPDSDFTANPQLVEIAEEEGKKAIHIDSPVNGYGITLQFPVLEFDETYTKDHYYKITYKAKKKAAGIVEGGNNRFFTMVALGNSTTPKLSVTRSTFVNPSDTFQDYEMYVDNIPEDATKMTVNFALSATSAVRDVYITDVKVYVKDGSKPLVLYDMPAFTPPANQHPRVYFTKQDIPNILANYDHPQNENAKAQLEKDLSTPVDGNLPSGMLNSATLGLIQSRAFHYAVWENRESGEMAVKAMRDFVNTVNYAASEYNNQGFLIFTIGAVYDWCFPLLSEEDKVLFQDMAVNVMKVLEAGYPVPKQNVFSSHSAEAMVMRDELALAIAMYDERPDIYQNIGGRYFAEMVDARKFMDQAQIFVQSSCYMGMRFQWEILSSIMMDKIGMPNVFGEDLHKVLYGFLYARRGDGQLLRWGDSDQNNAKPGVYDTDATRALFLAGNYYKDPYLKGQALLQNPGIQVSPTSGNQTLTAFEVLLFNDPSVEGKTPGDLPLSAYYPSPRGGMIARTGWQDGIDSPAVVADMKVNEYWTMGHQHLDAGSFQIYYKGALANDTGYYQAGRSGDPKKNEGNTVYGTVHFHNYARRTIAHNCMLVYDPNEPSMNFNGYVNDGGQRLPNCDSGVMNMEEFMALEDEYRVGTVLGQEFGPDPYVPDYTYLKGDIAAAYSDKVSAYERSFQFLNLKDEEHPAAMLVFDRVVSADPAFKKSWLLHGLEEPEITGNQTVFRDTRKGYNGKLTVDTLLPSPDNTSIEAVGGEGKEFLVNGTNYWAETLQGGVNEGGGYRIEVSPKKAATEDYFLNVLQVGDNEPDTPPLEVTKLETETFVGAKLADRVALFGKFRDRTAESMDFSFEGEGRYQITVADLQCGTWAVQRNGETLAEVFATQEGGIVSFEGEAGDYRLTYAGACGSREELSGQPPQQDEGIHIRVNNRLIYSDVAPVTINDRTMVPMRAVFQNLQAEVEWDEATMSATAVKENTTIRITDGSETAYVNGEAVTLDSPAVIRDGRFLVPVRFVSESFGARVVWEEFSKTVDITYNAGISEENYHNITGWLPVAAMEQSGDDGAGNVIEQTRDGAFSTSWGVQGVEGSDSAWGIYDFGQIREIEKVMIAFIKGTERIYTFTLQTSEDGKSWKTVLDQAKSSGTSNQFETFAFDKTKARYMKYIGYGNSVNLWSNISEIVFIGK